MTSSSNKMIDQRGRQCTNSQKTEDQEGDDDVIEGRGGSGGRSRHVEG